MYSRISTTEVGNTYVTRFQVLPGTGVPISLGCTFAACVADGTSLIVWVFSCNVTGATSSDRCAPETRRTSQLRYVPNPEVAGTFF